MKFQILTISVVIYHNLFLDYETYENTAVNIEQ